MGFKKEIVPSKSARILRRNEATPKTLSNLLNFEENPNIIEPECPIKIISEPTKDSSIVKFDFKYDTKTAVVPLTDLKEEGVPSKQTTGRRGLRESTVNKHHHQVEDPLSHQLYDTYHRKMEKEEKRMANRDREKIYFQADELKSDLASLNSLEWTRCLPHITYVRDPKDPEEMEKKRELTRKYMETVLDKFSTYKKREDRITKRARPLPSQGSKIFAKKGHLTEKDLQIYTKVDRYEFMVESDTDGEEEVMTNEEIKSHRERKLFNRFGPRIKLNLTNGKALIAEPFKGLKVLGEAKHRL